MKTEIYFRETGIECKQSFMAHHKYFAFFEKWWKAGQERRKKWSYAM